MLTKIIEVISLPAERLVRRCAGIQVFCLAHNNPGGDRMRLVARMPNQDQVGFLVDSLRNAGFDRKDMIISDLADVEQQRYNDPEAIADQMVFVKAERDGLWEAGAYADGIKGLDKGKRGIIVAVETPKHESDRVRTIMEQSGAAEIIQD